MSKQAKGTLNVWLSSGSYTKASELHKLDDKELEEMRAEHQQAQNRLTKRINELLAIENEAQL